MLFPISLRRSLFSPASTEHTRTTLVAAVQARLEIASLPVPTSEARAFAIGTASVSTAILNAHACHNNNIKRNDGRLCKIYRLYTGVAVLFG